MAAQPDTVIVSYIGIFILSLGTLLHALGLNLLGHVKETRTHQNIILMNLGFAEIILSARGVADFSYQISGKIINTPASMFFRSAVTTFYLIMMSLTLHGLFMTVLPLRYNIVVTRKKMRVVLMFCWLIGFIVGAIFSILNSYQVAFITSGSLHGIFLILAITTYAIIFGKK